jgi:GNAT superfamily N-acetyltransferase
VGRGRRGAGRARLLLGPAAHLSVLQTYLRAVAAEGRERRVTRCFDVYIRPGRPSPHSNYAIPHDEARPGADDVMELVAAFESAGRMPRLEFLPSTAPAAEPALVAAGFSVELRTSVMACTPESLAEVEHPAGLTLEALDEQNRLEDVDAMARVQAEAFGDEHQPLEQRPDWLGSFIAVLARVDGEPAGGGMCLARMLGTTELVGIAVAGRFRRRGIAAALTADLARRAFADGAGQAILTPGGDDAGRVYARAGFEVVDEMLHLRGPQS